MINVFNSFPIIWVMTNGGPGYQTDTTTTFMYKIAFRSQNVGQSAAMAVVNFAIILVFVLLYLRTRQLAGTDADAMSTRRCAVRSSPAPPTSSRSCSSRRTSRCS